MASARRGRKPPRARAVLIFEPLGLAGAWMKTRLYFRLWPFR